ncbi:MAG: hypothetical protein IJY57_00440 [Clostridia bacterium]|nr:hypothetical protein [Clostridia bacterium]
MIFCFDALGNTLGTVNERVYQGSSGANTIYFLSPVDENAVVSISARFSNGKTEGPFVMNSLKDRISGLFDKELKAFSVWEKKVDAILTGVSGKVELQFNVTSMSGEVVATKTVNFIVRRGVSVKEPEQGDSYNELIKFVSALNGEYNALKESVEKVDELSADTKGLKEQVSLISELIDRALIKKSLVKIPLSSRTTAGGLNIIDGMKTQVCKIYGKTGNNYEQGGLCDIMFKGIVSYGANVFDTNIVEYTIDGLTVKFDRETGEIYLNGRISAGTNIHLQHTIKKGSGNMAIKYIQVGGGCFNATNYSSCNGIKVKLTSADGSSALNVDKENTFASGYISNGMDNYMDISIDTWADSDIMIQAFKFKVMVVDGLYTEETMPEFKVFVQQDDSFFAPTTIRLGEYDYIDVINKKIVRKTVHTSKDAGFTQEELLAYPKRVLSIDGRYLAYEGDEETVSDIVIPDSYLAYYAGKEQAVYDTNYFRSGDITVEQYYFVKI